MALASLSVLFLIASPLWGQEDAYDIYSRLVTGDEARTNYLIEGGYRERGYPSGITWGFEKEGTTPRLMRLVSPTRRVLKRMIRSLSPHHRELFLRDFFTHYLETARYRMDTTPEGGTVDLALDGVKDIRGHTQTINLSRLHIEDLEEVGLGQLERRWNRWLWMARRSPFSFLAPSVREKFFLGELPGMDGLVADKGHPSVFFDFYDSNLANNWTPILGPSEWYVDEIVRASTEWEIRSLVQTNYGGLEEMRDWIRQELNHDEGELYNSSEHHRVVFRERPKLERDGLKELIRILQAFVVLSEVKKGKTIPNIKHKRVLEDEYINDEREWKGSINIERGRWGMANFGIELRLGTKDPAVFREFHAILASRIIANDFSFLESFSSWTLIDDSRFSVKDLMDRFGISEEVGLRVSEKLKVENNYDIPLWYWEKAPFIDEEKKHFLKDLTRRFISDLDSLEYYNDESLYDLIGKWASDSGLTEDIKSYMIPRPGRGVRVATRPLSFVERFKRLCY